jgi:hypothetical protein
VPDKRPSFGQNSEKRPIHVQKFPREAFLFSPEYEFSGFFLQMKKNCRIFVAKIYKHEEDYSYSAVSPVRWDSGQCKGKW